MTMPRISTLLLWIPLAALAAGFAPSSLRLPSAYGAAFQGVADAGKANPTDADAKKIDEKPAPDLTELARQAASVRQGLNALPDKAGAWPTMKVNGVAVEAEELLRSALYFSGEGVIQGLRLFVATEREIERQAKAGKDVAKYRIDDAKFQEQFSLLQRKVEEMKPDLTWEQFLSGQKQTPASFAWSFRSQAVFDSVWFPVDEAEWPAQAEEAAASLYQGTDAKMRSDTITRIKEAIKKSRDPNNADPNVGVATFLVKRQLISKLLDTVPVQDALDGIPKDVGLVVGDMKFKSRELQDRGMGLGGYMEALKAIEFMTAREALHQAIVAKEETDWAAAKADAAARRAKGEDVPDPARPVYWLADGSDVFKEAFENEKKKYPTPPFDLKGLVHFRKFPSMQIYRLYFQMIESFRRATAKERTEDLLAGHVDRSKLFFTNGSAEAEVIWFAYHSDTTKGSHEDGFDAARKRAEQAIADLKKGAELAKKARKAAIDAGKTAAEAEAAAIEAAKGFTFLEIQERDSDYRDGMNPNQPGTMAKVNRGRFGPQQRNPLVEKLHESELATLLQGYSIGEELFFRAPIGEVVGPFRGAEGFYIARVQNRTPGGKVFELKETSSRELALDDMINHQFIAFVNEAIAKAKIEVVN